MPLTSAERAANARAGHARSMIRAQKQRRVRLALDVLARENALNTVTPHFHGAALALALEQIRTGPVTDDERAALDHVARSIPAFRMWLRRHRPADSGQANAGS